MNLIAKGKTKDVYELEPGIIKLFFKDDITGDDDGNPDSGGNNVIGKVEGVGEAALKLTTHFFKIFNQRGIPTHYIDTNFDEKSMTVKRAQAIGKGFEFICRFNAYGSFIRRFGDFIEEGAPLNSLVEVTLKDDERGDPFISKEVVVELGLLTEKQYDRLLELTKEISNIIKEEFTKKNLKVIDLKLEFGTVGEDVILIDEVSMGNMRVFDANDNKLSYKEATRAFFKE